jgi:hypothetical protein
VEFNIVGRDRGLKKMDFYDEKQAGNFEIISGTKTKMRKLARECGTPPDGFMVEKAWKILADYYKSLL